MSDLKKRLERLERVRPIGAPIIIIEPGETKKETLQEHLAKHPDQEEAGGTIFICPSYFKEVTPG